MKLLTILVAATGAAALTPTVIDYEAFVGGNCVTTGDRCKVFFKQEAPHPRKVATKVQVFDHLCSNYDTDNHQRFGNKTIDWFFRWGHQDMMVETIPKSFPEGIKAEFGRDPVDLSNMHCHLSYKPNQHESMCWFSIDCPQV